MQSHRSDPRILGRRTLEQDHRLLAGLLRPGLSVLDVGCGTGAITRGIAEAVGLAGFVTGVDRDAVLLGIALRDNQGVPNLSFVRCDATRLPFDARFDIVTAARMLQWISEPEAAIARMKSAARRSGLLVALDYDHALNEWRPEPPVEFREFYRAFLAWRQANRWDNRMATHLPGLFRLAGLTEVESHVQDEVDELGEPRIAAQAELWPHVIETIGERVVEAGFLDESRRQLAIDAYRAWARANRPRQTLKLRGVVGRVP